jgi:hypothetical protein
MQQRGQGALKAPEKRGGARSCSSCKFLINKACKSSQQANLSTAEVRRGQGAALHTNF